MISAIEGDRERRPRIEFWGDGLYRVDVPTCSLTLPFGDVCSVYHVHRFDLRGKFLLPPSAQLPGLLIIILALRFPFLVFAVYLAGLFKDPAISISMVCRFVWGAMYLARTIEYAVQAGWSSASPFIGLLALAGLGTTESGMNCCVIGVIAIASAFVSIAPELAGAFLALEGPLSLAVFVL